MTLVIAHRGYSEKFPENTLAAVRGALKIGVDQIEIDVQLSSDGHVIVMHDNKVNRTTNGKGYVSALTLAELKVLDAGGWKDESFAGEKIPTFEEILKLIVDKKQNPKGTKLLVELKFDWITCSGLLRPINGLVEEVVSVVQKMKAQELVIVQSFLEEYLIAAKVLDARIKVHLLVFPWRMLYNSESLLDLPFDSFNPSHLSLSKSFVETAKRKNKSVIVWTVDGTGDVKRCLALGVNGIITNKAADIIQILDNRAENLLKKPTLVNT
mmetsp:Transcript_15216/g.18458  ORF Transcript_15216/g.18458 Transcript_15216/m.18458 type:complete len:268 (+) Transcript_15216:78-881(+)